MPEKRALMLEAAVGLYSDMLLRVGINMLGKVSDAEDAVQETWLRYMRSAPDFDSEDYEKAWLLRVCVNVCRDIRRGYGRREYIDISEIENLLPSRDEESRGIIEAVMALPPKLRTVVELYYIEGLDGKNVASVLGISPASVRKRLERGRKLLRLELD